MPNPHDGPVNVEISELFWKGDELVAATFGRGMWKVRPLGVIYVDWRNTGPTFDGTLFFPFRTVQEGIDVAGNGTTISIASGTYDEVDPTVFFKRGSVVTTGGTVTIK